MPGEYRVENGFVELNVGRESKRLIVVNKGDRPIQVGSHYPFFETNPALEFDRKAAYGCRLDIPSGTAVRFEPGSEKEIELIPVDGEKIIFGGNALISGHLSAENKKEAVKKMKTEGFLDKRV